jgi:ABC-type Na+ efflux pump permease subunit
MRLLVFYFLLCVPILAWAIVVLPNDFSLLNPDLSGAAVSYAVALSPVVGGDVSIFGEVTPVVLASLIIALVPQSNKTNYFAVCLAFVSYLLFLHLSVYFSSGTGVGILENRFRSITEPQKIILTLISNIRVMAIVVCAALLGFTIKSSSKEAAR